MLADSHATGDNDSPGPTGSHDIAIEAKHALPHRVPKLVGAAVHVSSQDTEGHDHHAKLAHHPGALEAGAPT